MFGREEVGVILEVVESLVELVLVSKGQVLLRLAEGVGEGEVGHLGRGCIEVKFLVWVLHEDY